MVTRIGQKGRAPRKMFFGEWREHRGLTQEQLADRLETTKGAVSKIENGHALFNQTSLEAWADALSCEPVDFYHHPDKPTPDELLRGQPAEVVDQAVAVLRALVAQDRKTRGVGR